LCIDLVVLPVRADEPDIDDAIRIIDPYRDAIVVARDVKDRATIGKAGLSPTLPPQATS
jgi:hypothetical protein